MVAELMGHKNIEVTHRYYTQYAVEKRKQIMRNFNIAGEEKKEENLADGNGE